MKPRFFLKRTFCKSLFVQGLTLKPTGQRDRVTEKLLTPFYRLRVDSRLTLLTTLITVLVSSSLTLIDQYFSACRHLHVLCTHWNQRLHDRVL